MGFNNLKNTVIFLVDTVDGSNPAPVDMVNIPLQGLIHISYMLGGAGFLPSTVCSIVLFFVFAEPDYRPHVQKKHVH